MLSEMILLYLMMVMSSQSSSLLSSIIIVPMSIITIVLMSPANFYSGLLMFLYVMVFIGGLIVLLMSMASISFQDQMLMPHQMMLLVLTLVSLNLSSWKSESTPKSLLLSVSWFENISIMISVLSFILLIGILVITYFLVSFKGMVRSF